MPSQFRAPARARALVAVAALATAALLGAACDDAAGLCDPAFEDCGGVSDTGSDVGGGDIEPDLPPPDDQDRDGILDAVEGEGDPDGDGIPNYLDDDSDGDGLLDRDETDADDDDDSIPSYLDDDSDNDGFLDSDEGVGDTDGDGLPNSRDTDSDGDGMDDAFEGTADTDDDGLLDRYDQDSDGDTIPDEFEGSTDPDEDGVPNFRDTDSDDDGWSDEDEYGRAPGSGLRPLESDDDGTANYVDLDSDGDGLGDRIELGCPESTERTREDSDDDGISDLVEVSFTNGPEDEGQACDADRDISDDVDFFFKLPYESPAETAPLDFLVEVGRADIAFNMDTTGSMVGERTQLVDSLTTVLIPALSREIDDSAYAFSQFDDFPCNGYGAGADRPFILRQRVTTSAAAASAGVRSLEGHGGSDYFESGFESIYQICTGLGRDNTCISGPEVEPFDPDEGFVAGVADGLIGGVGFRDGALPIIVHITDAPSHVKGETDGAGDTTPYQYGASRNETYASMRTIGAKFIGVASMSDARNDLETLAVQARSTVPACAWTDPIDGVRPLGCGESQCCTGGSGVGREGVDGVCPLVYDISSSGAGLDSSIVAGVQALINFATFDLTTRVRRDPEVFETEAIDTSLFIESVVPVSGSAPGTGCADDPGIGDLDRDGVPDHFLDVVPGSQLLFTVTARNDHVRGEIMPRTYTAWIDVVQQGGAVLDTRQVTILVPPTLKPTD